MHRSRLSTFLIDTALEHADASAAFWSHALGVATSSPADEPQYISLHAAVPGLNLAVQRVADDSRYHLDIETDDVEAEVDRLRQLGATPVAVWQGCHTLRAPGGHLLCVIPLHSDPATFDALAHTWP